MALSREEISQIATKTADEVMERRGDICKCVDWFLVAVTAAEALEHNATVSDMAKDLHEKLKEIIPPKQLEDLEFENVLLQGYITERMAELALSGSLGSIRDKCNVDISDVKKLAASGFEAIKKRDPIVAAHSFTKVKVELLRLADNICGQKSGNPGMSEDEVSIIDLRGDYDEIAYVKDGILYRRGKIVQVWWDKWGKETWTGPSEEQARENFNAMKERWSSSELSSPKEYRLAPIPTKPEVVGKQIAEATGLRFDGVQEGIGLQFTDIEQTGTTFYANTLKEARTKLEEKRRLFAEAKEPWQMTLEEYAIEKGARPAWVKAGYGETYRFHKTAVERAIREGKPVPPEVLADYPALLTREGNPSRVHFDRASIDSAIAAARRLKSDRNLYIFATHLGYTIDGRPPPGMQQYVIVHPDGSTETIKPSVEGNPVPTGTCYEEAWRFLIKQEEGELVHGTVLSLGKRIGHAWVELPTGYIWEPQTEGYFTHGDFQTAALPIEEHRYTVEEAAIMLARVGKHGQWTDEERARWLPKAPPAVGHLAHPS